jgi:hypothetical protein
MVGPSFIASVRRADLIILISYRVQGVAKAVAQSQEGNRRADAFEVPKQRNTTARSPRIRSRTLSNATREFDSQLRVSPWAFKQRQHSRSHFGWAVQRTGRPDGRD